MDRTVEQKIVKKLSFSEISITLIPIGADYQILVSGGDRPHIGSTVIAIPRPSLKEGGAPSCTSSVYNLTGHKDENICRYLAETLCRKSQTTVVCTGGFHVDNITKDQIQEVLDAVKSLGESLETCLG